MNFNSHKMKKNVYGDGLVTKLCPTLVTPWTIACQAPVSMGFHRKNTRAGCHFLLQGIFSTQGSNPCLLHWQADSLPLSHRVAQTLP